MTRYLLGAAVCLAVIWLWRRRRQHQAEQSPEPRVQRYHYTTERTYNERLAVAAARAARARTPSGRKFRKPATPKPATITKFEPRAKRHA